MIQIVLPYVCKCGISTAQLPEKEGDIRLRRPFQTVRGTVGFQTAAFPAVTERAVSLNAHVCNGPAVHAEACVDLSVYDDRAAQVWVQKNYNGIPEFFLMPGLQIGGSLGVVFQTAGVWDIAGEVRELHARMLQYPSVAYSASVRGDKSLNGNGGP